MNNDKAAALLPCPFCGGAAELSAPYTMASIAHCPDSDCRGHVWEKALRDEYAGYETEAEAIRAWNRRAQPAQPVAAQPAVDERAAFDAWWAAGGGRAQLESWRAWQARAALDKPALAAGQMHANHPETRMDAISDVLVTPAQVVSAGWKLVPVEPTEQMIHAGEDVQSPRLFGETYRAMLDASPAPPAGLRHE